MDACKTTNSEPVEVPSAAFTPVPLDTTIYETSVGMHSTTVDNDRIKVLSDGRYDVQGAATFEPGGGAIRELIVQKNGTNVGGTAGSNEAFKHNSEAAFGTAVGASSVRNCVAYNCKRGYRMALAGATMTVTNSVFDNDIVGIAAGQVVVQQNAGSLDFHNNVMVSAGDGTAFTAVVAVENHNDVFNFAALGKALDGTDLTIDPLFEDPVNHLWNATAPAVMAGASDGMTMGLRYVLGGEQIIWCGAP